MSKITIYTNRFTERDKESAQKEINNGNQVCIYPTCMNSGRCQIIKYQSEEFFKSIGAKPVDDASIADEEYIFFRA